MEGWGINDNSHMLLLKTGSVSTPREIKTTQQTL